MGPNHWTAMFMRDNADDMSWVPASAFVDETNYYEFPVYLVESPDYAVMELAATKPGFLGIYSRKDLVFQHWMGDDPGRVTVRHEHLEALAAATNLTELQAARDAIQADTGYPPAP